MSENDKNQKEETPDDDGVTEGTAPGPDQNSSTQDGPKFEQAPDPLAGVRKSTSDVLDSMEGKTVSMKTYVGTIIGVIVLMLLARCGG
jgi:hypothetical protein